MPINPDLFPPPDPDDTQPSLSFKPVSVPPKRGTPLAWTIVLALAVLAQIGLVLVGGAAVVASMLDHNPDTLTVTLIVDGDAVEVHTLAATVGDLLAEQNIALQEGDTLSSALSSLVQPDLIVEVKRARDVTINVDGTTHTVYTAFDSPLDILNSAGVAVSAYDLVFLDGTQTNAANLIVWPVPVNRIDIRRAVAFEVNDDGTLSTLITTAPTVGEALFEAGITLYLGDQVTPDLNAAPYNDLKVSIDRSRPVTIIADGLKIETRTRGQTVGEALVEAEITLVGLDYAIPDEATPVLPGISIRVIRVKEDILTEQTLIDFETVYQADSTLELDQRAVIQEGERGVEEQYVRVRYENGIEIDRQVEEITRVREPVNRVVAYGTNIVLRTVETPEGPREYWRKFRMLATSYYPGALGGDNVTATGKILTKGIVAIDPGIISYGTKVYVPNYGIGLAADTGGPRSTRYWIDLGYDDENWVSWSRWVDVYVLTPVPDRINYLLPTPPQR